MPTPGKPQSLTEDGLTDESRAAELVRRYAVPFRWPVIFALALGLTMLVPAHHAVEWGIVYIVYGADAWRAGLRIVWAPGVVPGEGWVWSDGRELGVGEDFVFTAGGFLIVGAVICLAMVGFCYASMILHGDRLADRASGRGAAGPRA